MWNTSDKTNITTRKLPRLTVVPYSAVEWLSEGGRTHNELMVGLEEMMRTDGNLPK